MSHSILTHNDDLKVFLTATPIEFSHHFKSKIGYLASISDSLYSLASPNGTPNLSSITCRVRDPEFSAVTDYMTSLYEKLSYFNSVSSRIVKERSDISAEMQVIRPILESWSQTERFNRDTLKINPQKTVDINHQADDDFPLGSILKKMAKPFHVTSAEQVKLTKEYPYIISNPIKEYLLYIQAVKEKLSRRDALQACLEGAQEKLTKKREKTSNGGIPSQQMSPQLPKLAQEIEDCHDRCLTHAYNECLMFFIATQLNFLLFSDCSVHRKLLEVTFTVGRGKRKQISKCYWWKWPGNTSNFTRNLYRRGRQSCPICQPTK